MHELEQRPLPAISTPPKDKHQSEHGGGTEVEDQTDLERWREEAAGIQEVTASQTFLACIELQHWRYAAYCMHQNLYDKWKARQLRLYLHLILILTFTLTSTVTGGEAADTQSTATTTARAREHYR